jgi:hypothetical protein
LTRDVDPSQGRPDTKPEVGRLDSWKEIAAYLRRDVTTVRRWEKREGLPVHRHKHDKLGSVHADVSEIDQWWQRRIQSGVTASDTVQRGELVPPGTALDSDPLIGVSSKPAVPPGRRVALILAGALSFVVLALAGFMWSRPTAIAARSVVRFEVFPPEHTGVVSIAISPDGTDIAMAVSAGRAGTRLWIRSLETVVADPLYGTEGAAFPFWSPDGRSIGFFAGGQLKRISVASRAVETICPAPNGRGGTWSPRGIIVFAPERDAPLSRVPASGGTVTPITALHRPGARGHVWPEFLPDGHHFLFLDDRIEPEGHGLYLGDLDGDQPKLLLKVYSNASHLPGGQLLFANQDKLLAQSLDLAQGELVGEPITIAEMPMMQYSIDHRVDFAASPSGMLAFRTASDARKLLTSFDRSGRSVRTFGEPAMYGNPVISPDGRQAAVVVSDPDPRLLKAEIWLVDLGTGALTSFTLNRAFNTSPVWSPTGDRIVFKTNSSGRFELRLKQLGTGLEERLDPRISGDPDGWSKSGRYLTYSTHSRTTRSDVWAWPFPTGPRPISIANTDRDEGHLQLSPDGRFAAYVSDESGRFEVYVKSFPGGQQKLKVSVAGGADPRWHPNGRELFYIAADRNLMAVPVPAAPGDSWGLGERLFEVAVDDLWEDSRNHYDVSPDGQRFLFPVLAKKPAAQPFIVILNWTGARLR